MEYIATSKVQMQPERLPPTERAAYFHIFRVHLQIFIWKYLWRVQIGPRDWGWEVNGGVFSPIMTDLEPAPEELQRIVRCKCTLLSKNPYNSNVCPCRENGLTCVTACCNCRGTECYNIIIIRLIIRLIWRMMMWTDYLRDVFVLKYFIDIICIKTLLYFCSLRVTSCLGTVPKQVLWQLVDLSAKNLTPPIPLPLSRPMFFKLFKTFSRYGGKGCVICTSSHLASSRALIFYGVYILKEYTIVTPTVPNFAW